MANFIKTKSGNWKADVRMRGAPRRTATFDTKAQAQAWAEEVERRIKEARHTGRTIPSSITLADALKRWFKDIDKYIEDDSKRGTESRPRIAKARKKNKSRYNIWLNHEYAELPLRSISQLHLERYIDARREDDKAEQTIRNDLYLLNGLFNHAAAATLPDAPTGWNWQIENPVQAACKARRLGKSRERDRRLQGSEYTDLIELFTRMRDAQLINPTAREHALTIKGRIPLRISAHASLLYIPAAFIAAVESAMRREKMFEMTWAWVDWRTGDIVIPDQLQGPDNKQVPTRLAASPDLQAIFRSLNGTDKNGQPIRRIGDALNEPVFGALLADRAYRLLQVACAALGIEDLRWHDLRHEACSRLADRGWTVFQIQRVSGHKTVQSLERYTHVQTSSIHALFAEEELKKQQALASLQSKNPIIKIA